MKPHFSKLPKNPYVANAYFEGRKRFDLGMKREDRPNYQTSEERDAFNQGWDEREDRVANGYP